MPDTHRLDSLQKSSHENYPNLTQLLRCAYRGLGADFEELVAEPEQGSEPQGQSSEKPKQASEKPKKPTHKRTGSYSQTKLLQQLGLDDTYRAVCVVLIDGMGLEQILACRAHTPFLRKQETGLIAGHTVLPSTTATALTSFTTGEFPGKTNMLGWSIYTEDGIGNLINFQNIRQAPKQWQPVPPLFAVAKEKFDIDSQVISHPRFANSGLTEAAFRGARFVGAETFADRIAAGIAHLQKGRGLAYLYWSELDHVGHERGWQSLEWANELEHVDANLRDLAAACPKDAAIILTADHGMIDVDPSQRIDLADYPTLSDSVKVIAGEGRCVQLYTQPGQAEKVVQNWKEFFGDKVLISTDPATVFRGRPTQRFTADALVFSLDRQVIVDSRIQPIGQVNLIGVHGSVTAPEVTIPMWRLA
ncbi:alkaline phosphatase family protein [Gleimia sp. 6138-11-ORH1]|uniref:alkaline phosphatase family protein n=1 Tax=Gleimia sp. 6138-11-ORH1 TaxID=2973937 RepID=UPI0021676642|nr:alkaline phosphatase family protein [Gleimia sp. 6138-11-ORH1]MCS4484436.1 alkaline phosphatase family protein [Gleimia sp. 6138-11-ORH1]